MNEFLKSLNKVLQRDLATLEKEISSYSEPQRIWALKGEIKNTAGNLCLHLCGNLSHFIGAILGKSGYVRNRDNEFSLKNIPTAELVNQINQTRKVLESTLLSLDPATLDKEYPLQVFGEPMTTQYFLMHLAGHLNYHLGQINYHRRMI